MKIMTILGTRPEIIRLSRVIPLLDSCTEHILVHTGQNFDRNLSDVFFEELGIRSPDHFFDIRETSPGAQIGRILTETSRVLADEKPDRLLVLGDTNSALSTIIAKRMRVPVYHMEAGNRCYDDRVPEETNRRIVDHSSDVLLPYTERSRDNLLSEGISGSRIFVTGNPIREVLDHYAPKIDSSTALERLKLKPNKFLLATLHRAENVDIPKRLNAFFAAFHTLARKFQIPVIVSIHPRTRERLDTNHTSIDDTLVRTVNPLGLFDFVSLQKNAKCVLSDSGTVQEECCIFQVPNVTIRDVTERPETIESGSNILSGANPDSINDCVSMALANGCDWQPPREYLVPNVSRTIGKILLSNRLSERR